MGPAPVPFLEPFEDLAVHMPDFWILEASKMCPKSIYCLLMGTTNHLKQTVGDRIEERRKLIYEMREKHVFGKVKTFQSVVLSSQNCLFRNFTKTSKLIQKGCINGMKIDEKSLRANPLG
jgi:hypothetical protein